mgnify:CR=1 FL=1
MASIEHDIVQYIPRLRRYARALLRGNTGAADDLVQDCLERALSRLHLWQRGSDLRAWLFTLMHNLYVNQLRRHGREVALEDMPELQQAAEPGHGRMSDIEQALGLLQPDQREILLMVTLEGLSYREVAGVLGIPEGTVMSRLARARERLRRALDGEGSVELRRVK